jgi:hypothetical protein
LRRWLTMRAIGASRSRFSVNERGGSAEAGFCGGKYKANFTSLLTERWDFHSEMPRQPARI